MKKMDSKLVTRIIALVVFDIVSVVISAFGSLWVRFDFKWNEIGDYLTTLGQVIGVTIFITLLSYLVWSLYKSVWRYAGANEFVRIVGATITTSLLQLIFCLSFNVRLPRSYYAFFCFFLTIITGVTRFGYRILRILQQERIRHFDNKDGDKVMMIGAGAAGAMILREIENSRYLNLNVKCIIDDNPGCHGKTLRGIPIVGGRDRIIDAVNEYAINEIIFAIPSATVQTKQEFMGICKETGCKLRTLPGMYQLINGDVSIAKLRDVDIEDLLGREPIKINSEEVLGMLGGQVVLVTGGGGSIGSELCRQIAGHNPKQLIIFDIYENNAYDIQQELKITHPELNLLVLIGSVRNTNRINNVFETYKPDVVYHAAAHKHVPLMEDSPNEAIKNNVMGTYKTAQAAIKYHSKKFVLISTDKAVNPTNVMGASKRICEMVVQSMNGKSETKFAMVRFGNVLGSNGSVIPLFKRQIMEGGPVTVTHPDIIRYFMTIPEAVSLVLQCGAYAEGGEIFVLDMGKPVKILSLAENLIKLSGYKPYEDIDIKFTGLRPGEKMFEELLMNEEGLEKTNNERIFIGKQIEFDEYEFRGKLSHIIEEAKNETSDIRQLIKDIVPTYDMNARN